MAAPAPGDNTAATPVSANRKRNAPGNPLWTTPAPGGAAQDFNLKQVNGMDQTPSDWSLDFVNLGFIKLLLGAGLPGLLRNARLDAADTYTAGEVLADQAGAGAVLTFTFANPMDLIWIESTGGQSRADPFGGVPAAGLGVICQDGIPKPIVMRTATIQVYAPVGASVNVFGQRYS